MTSKACRCPGEEVVDLRKDEEVAACNLTLEEPVRKGFAHGGGDLLLSRESGSLTP